MTRRSPSAAHRVVLVVGIGPGDASMVTIQALAALREVDAVIVFDKGERATELQDLRHTVLDRAREGRPCRVIALDDERRDPGRPYRDAVHDWHRSRVEALEQALLDEVGDGERVAMLVWGDPSLYDSTLRLLNELRSRGRVEVDVEVVPGVSSLQLLAARHAVPLHEVGGSLLITTGRRLREGLPAGIDDVVVFLDRECSFTVLRGDGWHIWWGACLGMPEEQLVAGPLDEVADTIVSLRTALRERLGWVFDLYLLRRR